MTDGDPGRYPAPPAVTRRRWVGFLGGVVFGAGVSLLLIAYSKIAFGTWPPVVITAFCALVGTVWSRWGPVRTIGTPPVVGSPEVDQRVEAAMRANLEIIRRGEQSADEPEADPAAAVPEAIGPPDGRGWHTEESSGPAETPDPEPTAEPPANAGPAEHPAPVQDEPTGGDDSGERRDPPPPPRRPTG